MNFMAMLNDMSILKYVCIVLEFNFDILEKIIFLILGITLIEIVKNYFFSIRNETVKFKAQNLFCRIVIKNNNRRNLKSTPTAIFYYFINTKMFYQN